MSLDNHKANVQHQVKAAVILFPNLYSTAQSSGHSVAWQLTCTVTVQQQ